MKRSLERLLSYNPSQDVSQQDHKPAKAANQHASRSINLYCPSSAAVVVSGGGAQCVGHVRDRHRDQLAPPPAGFS